MSLLFTLLPRLIIRTLTQNMGHGWPNNNIYNTGNGLNIFFFWGGGHAEYFKMFAEKNSTSLAPHLPILSSPLEDMPSKKFTFLTPSLIYTLKQCFFIIISWSISRFSNSNTYMQYAYKNPN